MARESAGITQETLAFDSGLTRPSISQLERGLKSPTLNALFRICDALGVRASELIARMEQARAAQARPDPGPTPGRATEARRAAQGPSTLNDGLDAPGWVARSSRGELPELDRVHSCATPCSGGSLPRWGGGCHRGGERGIAPLRGSPSRLTFIHRRPGFPGPRTVANGGSDPTV